MKYLQHSKRLSYSRINNDRSYQLYNLGVYVNTKLYNPMVNYVQHDLFNTLYKQINTKLYNCLIIQADRVHK